MQLFSWISHNETASAFLQRIRPLVFCFVSTAKGCGLTLLRNPLDLSSNDKNTSFVRFFFEYLPMTEIFLQIYLHHTMNRILLLLSKVRKHLELHLRRESRSQGDEKSPMKTLIILHLLSFLFPFLVSIFSPIFSMDLFRWKHIVALINAYIFSWDSIGCQNPSHSRLHLNPAHSTGISNWRFPQSFILV
jgi:hypothetical protein